MYVKQKFKLWWKIFTAECCVELLPCYLCSGLLCFCLVLWFKLQFIISLTDLGLSLFTGNMCNHETHPKKRKGKNFLSSKAVPWNRRDMKMQNLRIVIFSEPHTQVFISWLCHRLFSFCAVTFEKSNCTFSKSVFLTATVELARLPQFWI